MATPELASAILASAQRLGISPKDLATVISYETAGTFDPWKAGPTTQWGQHRGLIQWGEPQRQKYGVTEGMPVSAQLEAAERYLKDAGVQPGMGLLDVYSAVNAGRVGRYNASDANNGGAPGTVADKVNQQMSGHMAKAEQLLGLAGSDPAAQASPAGMTPPQQQIQPTQTAQAPSPAAAPTGLMGLLASAAPQEQQADPMASFAGLLAPSQQQESSSPELPRGLLARKAAPRFALAKINTFRS